MTGYFPGKMCGIGLATLVFVAAVSADAGVAAAQSGTRRDPAQGVGGTTPLKILSSLRLNDGGTVITLVRRPVEMTKEARRDLAIQVGVKESELNYSRAEMTLVATENGKRSILRSDSFVHESGNESSNAVVGGFGLLNAARMTNSHPGGPSLLVLTTDMCVRASAYRLDRQDNFVKVSEFFLETNQWSSTGDVAAGAAIEVTEGGILVRVKHKLLIPNIGGKDPDKFRYTQYVGKVQADGVISWSADPKNYK